MKKTQVTEHGEIIPEGYGLTESGSLYKKVATWKMEPKNYTRNNGKGQTIQGASFTISQLLSRHSQGLPIPEVPQSNNFTDDINSPDMNKLIRSDFTEQQQFAQHLDRKTTTLKTQITEADNAKKAKATKAEPATTTQPTT